MKGRVCEIDSPEADVRTICPLGTTQQFDSALDRIVDSPPEQRRVRLADFRKSRNARGRTLDIGTLGHALSKHLRRIDILQPRRRSPPFIRAEAAVGVLSLQDEFRRLRDPLVRNSLGYRHS